MYKIIIADDHTIVREGLKLMLAQEFSDAQIGEAMDAVSLLRAVREQDWNLVILDIGMPGRSGLEVLKDLQYERPHLPVLVLSMHPEEQFAMRVLRAGAAGYMTKKSAPDELISAVRKVLEGGQYLSSSATERLLRQLKSKENPATSLHGRLSDREYQVMCMIASGKTVSEVAQELSLSVKTVSTHRAHILAKMQMRTNAELTRYAIENRLVQ
jgi:two-component system invasion response regulator UvrY